MARFIRYDNQVLVNLDLVTQIYITDNDKHTKVYFIFDAMENDTMNETLWEVKSKSDLAKIVAKLNVEYI